LVEQLKEHQLARAKLAKEIEDLVNREREQRAKDEYQFKELMNAKKKTE